MKTLLLIFLATVAVRQTTKKCNPKTFFSMSINGVPYKCLASGVLEIDEQAMKRIEDEEQRKDDLVWAMQTRPLTDSEMQEVKKSGKYILTHNMRTYSDEQITQQFEDLLRMQNILRRESQSARKPFYEECTGSADPDVKTVCESIPGPKPEVMDVPAVKEDIERPDVTAYRYGILGGAMGLPIQEGPPYRWTCSDKRRVLLTDESGGKHCILFPSQPSTSKEK